MRCTSMILNAERQLVPSGIIIFFFYSSGVKCALSHSQELELCWVGSLGCVGLGRRVCAVFWRGWPGISDLNTPCCRGGTPEVSVPEQPLRLLCFCLSLSCLCFLACVVWVFGCVWVGASCVCGVLAWMAWYLQASRALCSINSAASQKKKCKKKPGVASPGPWGPLGPKPLT